MNKKRITTLAYLLIALFCTMGLIMVFLVIPTQTGFYRAIAGGQTMSALYIAELIIYISLSIPCFFVLLIGLKITRIIIMDDIFSNKIIKVIHYAGIILFVDSALFVLSNVVFFIIANCFAYEVLYILLGIVGASIGIVLIIVVHYWKAAIKLKKENEEFI